jgi:hypothetical protein
LRTIVYLGGHRAVGESIAAMRGGISASLDVWRAIAIIGSIFYDVRLHLSDLSV